MEKEMVGMQTEGGLSLEFRDKLILKRAKRCEEKGVLVSRKKRQKQEEITSYVEKVNERCGELDINVGAVL